MGGSNCWWLLFTALTLGASVPAAAAQPGQKLWEFQTGGIVWSSPAIGTDGTVYVGSSARRVYALDGATGEERWEFPIGGGDVWCSPAIGADGTVYVGSSDNKLFALNGATGAKLWEFKAGGEVLSSPAIATDGTVYVGSSDGKVHALNGATGQSLWEFQTGGAVSSSPAIGADGTVYVGSDDQRIYALNGATGNQRWEFQADSAVNSSPAIGANGTVYLGSAGGKVYALNGTTGQKLWEFARIPDEAVFVLSSSPVLGADETVYVGSGSPDNKVYALNGATGGKLWEFQTGWYVLSSPAIGADGTLYVGSLDGNVYALSGATGEKRWEYYVGDQVWSSPAVGSDGTVYVGSYNGKVYALSSNSLGGLAASPWPKFHANALSQGRVRTTTGPARIVTQSTGRMVAEGTPLGLEVMAEGASPLRYEWFLNGQLLANATGPAYRVQAWAANQAGVYRVRVSNAEGAAESAEMAVTLGYAVTVAVVGAGSVKGTNESGLYAPGAVLELTAVAAEGCLEPGCSFAGWGGDVSGQTNPLRVTVDRMWRLTATFGGTKPGLLRWEFRAAGPVRSSPAIGADGTVYVAADYPARSVYAVNAATGQRLWEFETSCCNVRSSPAIGLDGTVYVGSGDSRVYALDGATGNKRWEFQAGSRVFSSPAVGSDGTVYVGSSDNKIHALNGATGQKLWEFVAGDQMAHVVSSSPAIGSDGTVFVGSADTKVYALHGATGQKRWEFPTGGEVWSSPAIGADGTVYVGSNDNKVYALSGATGQKRWEFETGSQVWSSPAIGGDGTVYVGSSDEKVYALDGATGQKRWECQTGFYVSSSPAIGADGTVYVGSNDNRIYALNGTTGQKLWEYRTGAIDWSAPAIGADGTVYVGSLEGRLYALSSSSVGGLADSPWPKFRQNARNTGRTEPAPVRPHITEQPVGVRVPVGSDFRLSVSASGSPPLTYQWFRNGLAVLGAVSSVFRVPDAALGHSGDYQVTVNNPAGAVTSQVARVVVGYLLTLTTNGVGSVQVEPTLEVYEPGQTVVLTAIPGADRTFVGWQGDVSGTSSPLTLTMNGSKHVEAVFSFQEAKLLWAFGTGSPIWWSSPAVGVDGTVYVGWNDGKLYAVDGATGVQKWTFATGSSIESSPAVGEDSTVYVGSLDRKVYAVDGATGAQKWALTTGGWVQSSPAVGVDGTVYVGSTDGKVHALNGATGAQKWVFATSGAVLSSPAVGVEGTVYFGSFEGKVYALDGATGSLQWSFLAGWSVSSSPAIGTDGTVYVGSEDRRVYALDGATGVQEWAFLTGEPIMSSPALGADGTVYVGSGDGKLYALDGATGAQKWAFVTGGWVGSSPALGADGTVYVGSSDRRVYALDGKTGALNWAFVTGGWVISSPAIGVDGTVYVGSTDGKLYALQGSAGLADSPWPKFHQNARNTGRQRVIAPVVLRQPSRVVLKEGATGRIAVKVAGVPAPGLQWFFDGQPIPGATETTLTIPSVTRAAEGIYTVVASNAVGQVTSQPILALISNVDPQTFLGLKWEGGNAGPVSLEATTQLDETAVWQPWFNYPSSGMAQLYVELDLADASRFYRLNSADARRFTAAGWLKGWWMVDPAGTRVRVETVSAASGWTHWQVLTDLALPASPYLFLDLENVGPLERVYRSTVIP